MGRLRPKLFLLVILLGFRSTASAQIQSDLTIYTSMFKPLPAAAAGDYPLTPEKLRLGKQLFFERALSKGQDISCSSCHNLSTFGVDNQPVSSGHQGQKGARNSPTVLNAALAFAQFWDGRAKDVEEQALGPILNPVEMAMSADAEVVERVKNDRTYSDLFKEVFPGETEPVSLKNIGIAIGAFERILVTPSRFDAYLKGESNAIQPEEKEGLKTFFASGCAACHSGMLLGGTTFQKLGLVKPYATTDLGRFEVTKQEADKGMFKVPTLRNVEKTAPYFHDGSVSSLDESVRLMAEYQLGKKLTLDDVRKINSFFATLTADIAEELKKP